MKRVKQNKKGYTLAELIMVLIILSTVIFIVTPKVGDFLMSNVRLKTTARKIAAVVRHTRNEALASGTQKKLVFDIEKNIYWVEDSNENKIKKTLYVTRLHEDINVHDVVLEKNKKITSGKVNIIFSPKGYNRKWMMHLGNKKDEFVTLLIKPLTGIVQIEESYVDWR